MTNVKMTLYRYKLLVLMLLGYMLIGCASVENNKRDPLESMNRAVFAFNEKFDDFVLEPVAKGYRAVTPDPLEMVIGNVFSNFGDVVITANALLQLKFDVAAASATRVLINTTFGMFGIIDIASDISAVSDVNLSKRNEDFGQTLGRYGIGPGPYFVIPFLGPSTIRDAVGIAVDSSIFHPIWSIYPDFDFLTVRLPASAGWSVDTRAQMLDTDKTLEEAALDKYEFVRDAYLQRRRNLVYDGNPPEEEGLETNGNNESIGDENEDEDEDGDKEKKNNEVIK
ncbi:MlaA family lipoprotein [Nitrosomonas communis]|jgi:phospholipid-binding lipoprotein MlaA|uniref:Phospholipid-binding lipoprotein MlaA n=1 Tax=Nitrosomonas communis TaxID=44574 RepID=A0A1I4N4D3_9PROT|nr:phospholipid-binding lipoprotein MlaA [Nitrosomonas communis]